MAIPILTIMAMVTDPTGMADATGLYKLLAWMSPGYPVGAYTYSHGLENAVETGCIADEATARDWIDAIAAEGAGFSDTVFLAQSWRAAEANDIEALAEVAELAAAFSATSELARETQAQGAAFLDITRSAWPAATLDLLARAWDGPVAYPVAIGAAAAGHGIALDDAARATLHAIVANLVSAAVRLVPLGQTQGQRILAALEPTVADTVARALETDLDGVASATLMIDIASMNHETQHTRLFRS